MILENRTCEGPDCSFKELETLCGKCSKEFNDSLRRSVKESMEALRKWYSDML